MSNPPLIHPFHTKWKPVALTDRECVSYLNRLFRSGWSLVPFDMDGIDWMMLSVPLKTTKTLDRRPDPVLTIMEQHGPSINVIVLRHDGRRDRFRAVLKERNDQGYFDYRSASGLDPKVWRSVWGVVIDDTSMCEIFARRNVGDSDR